MSLFNNILIILVWILPIQNITAAEPVPITLEFALDDEKKNWGLMQRSSLPKDYGMLFDFDSDRMISLWSFNCLIDLSVAFLDHRGVIQEITLLKAYPNMIDPYRPILSLKDLKKYLDNDPILLFFFNHRVTSTIPCRYALETDPSFFMNHRLVVGDLLVWENPATSLQGVFLRPLDLTYVTSVPIRDKIRLQSQKPEPIALRAPDSMDSYYVEFYNPKEQLIKSGILKGQTGIKMENRPLLVCLTPVSFFTIKLIVPLANESMKS